MAWHAGYMNANIGSGNYEGPKDSSGQPIGEGKMWFNDGNFYEGTWSNGRYDGSGTLKTKEFEYNGSFSKGYITGEGTMTYKNKGMYQGWFVKRHRDGRGTMTWNNGNSYTGIWKDDNIKGFGKVTWSNGDWWEATWDGTFAEIWDGRGQQGNGRAYWHWKGELYFGATRGTYRHGLGTVTTRDYKFEGNFKNGKRDGTFKVTDLRTKKVTHRKYVNDELA